MDKQVKLKLVSSSIRESNVAAAGKSSWRDLVHITKPRIILANLVTAFVTANMDAGAWILFFILFFWQPPHFWALGIRREEEYRTAGFPILPVVKGVRRTKIQMIPYVVLLILTTVLLYTFKYAGLFYLVSATILGLIWLSYCLAGFFTKDDDAWAGKTAYDDNSRHVLYRRSF